MIAHLPRVIAKRAACAALVFGLLRRQIRLERDLRIDDDRAAARQLDDEVGPLASELADERRLLVEVAVIEHAGELDDAPQLHFAPASAHGRRPQRADEIVRSPRGGDPAAG